MSKILPITKKEAQDRAALSVRELAEILGVSPITVYRKVENGSIPSIAVGRRKLIPNSYFSQFFADAGGKK